MALSSGTGPRHLTQTLGRWRCDFFARFTPYPSLASVEATPASALPVGWGRTLALSTWRQVEARTPRPTHHTLSTRC